ncbi:MAG: hypothetical protein ACT4SY_01560 [Hyphomicrobiales bacterium]
MTKDKKQETASFRRRIFYISGFDPRGPAHYHRLYAEEAAKQAAVNGLAVEVGPRLTVSDIESAWRATSAQAEAHYSFLRYDDLIRKRWARSNWAVLGEILRYAWLFASRGVVHRVLFRSWPPFATMAYPFALVLLATILAASAGLVANYFLSPLAGVAAAAAAFGLLVMLRAPLETRISAFWIARILSFIADQGTENVPDMDARIDRFARRIAESFGSDGAGEVLIVGHSVGTQIAVAAAARALGLAGDRELRLSLLTLGHTIPLEALHPKAHRFRSEIMAVAGDPRVTWIDVSAAIDSACFPLCDPLAASGLAQPDPLNPKPKIVSPQFAKLFRPDSYRRLRREFKRAHFQYLLSAELAGDYDYFLITAGNRRLGERFAHRDSVRNFDQFKLWKS